MQRANTAVRQRAWSGGARMLVAVVLTTLVLLPGMSAGEERQEPRLIIVALVDSLRADHVGIYGYERNVTPNLDRFARDAAVFENAVTACPWTPPSVGTILTGLYPREHGIRAVEKSSAEGVSAFRSGVRTVAQRIQARGMRTVGVVANPWLTAERGYARGFDRWVVLPKARAKRLVDEALQEIQGVERPLFLYLHFMDVHCPYAVGIHKVKHRDLGDLPERFRGKRIDKPWAIHNCTGWNGEEELAKVVDAYDQGIRAWDDEFGRLMKILDEEKSAAVIVVADHGEELYDHGGWTHGHTVYQELLRVPLVVRAPGIPKGRVRRPVSLVELAPALAGLARGRPAGLLDGSLSPATLYSEVEAANTVGFGGLGRKKTAVIVGQKKLLRFGERVRAFDLTADPEERHPLPHPDEALLKALERWDEKGRLLPQVQEKVPLPDSVRENLRMLGY